MAPKVRHPKAMVAPRRRPAAVLRGGAVRRDGIVRRPARRKSPEVEAVGPGEDEGGLGVRPQWDRGDECRLLEVGLGRIQAGQEVVLKDAIYYGGHVKVAGRIVRMESEGGDWFLALRLTGTTSEGLLHVHSQDPRAIFRCHLCPRECGQLEVGDYLLHTTVGRKVIDFSKEEPWVHNLERGRADHEVKDDELADLRKRSQEMAPLGPGAVEPRKVVAEDSDSGVKKKKKKKKEKGRDESKKAKAKKLTGKRPVSACQKELQEVFGGTGLDPRDKVRRVVLKKARKYLAKKTKSSSSSESSSKSGSEDSQSTRDALEEKEGIFSGGNRVRSVSENYPGALCCEAVRSMRESLLTEDGTDVTTAGPRPVAVKYYRQQLHRRAPGPVGRDMLNVASALDLLLKGKIASAADLLAQRLKSAEPTLNGTHWMVSLKMEIPQTETPSIAPKAEVHHAQRENYSDSRVTYLASLGSGRKGDNPKGKNEKGGKGKWDNPSKGDPKGDKGRGKGNQKETNKGGGDK